MTDEEYFSHPYISASKLKIFAGPEWNYSRRQALHKLQTPRKPNDGMAVGSIFHEIMEKGWTDAKACPYSEFRTNEAKAWKASHDGPIIKQSMIDTAKMMAESVKLTCPDIWDLARSMTTQAERPIFNHDLKLKCKEDLFDASTGEIYDWKLAYDVTPSGIRRACDRLHYDLQEAQYLKTDVDASVFNFLFVQSEPPFEVVKVPGQPILERGMRKWEVAMERYKRRMDGVLNAVTVDPAYPSESAPLEEDLDRVEL